MKIRNQARMHISHPAAPEITVFTQLQSFQTSSIKPSLLNSPWVKTSTSKSLKVRHRVLHQVRHRVLNQVHHRVSQNQTHTTDTNEHVTPTHNLVTTTQRTHQNAWSPKHTQSLQELHTMANSTTQSANSNATKLSPHQTPSDTTSDRRSTLNT